MKLNFTGVDLCSQGLSDVPVCGINNKSKTGPYSKSSAERYGIFIVLISANLVCGDTAIVLHLLNKVTCSR